MRTCLGPYKYIYIVSRNILHSSFVRKGKHVQLKGIIRISFLKGRKSQQPFFFSINAIISEKNFDFLLLNRWFVLDAETRDLVSIHTDGNEQLSVMRYSLGRQIYSHSWHLQHFSVIAYFHFQ